MSSNNTIYVYTDGGSRGNPGQSAIGVFIVSETGEILGQIGKKIGIATNNVAEYQAIREGFIWLLEHKELLLHTKKIMFKMDSELAFSQLTGLYKIKNAKLRELLFDIRIKEKECGVFVSYQHIPREENKKADALVNKALDGLL